MFLQGLSDYINANAPMSNLPELLGLHHGNPLGLHPIVVPIVLLVLAVAMNVTCRRIHHGGRDGLYPLLFALVGTAVACTYYYCFSDDLPLFLDRDLHRREISVGWFCQRDIVGLGWSLAGELLLTYVVFCFMSALLLSVARLSDWMGMEERQWMEWRYIVFWMILGASAAGVSDEFAPITGVWLMVVYQAVMVLMIFAKTVLDIVRTRNVVRPLWVGIFFFFGMEAVTMLAVECIEGNIYIFIPVVFIFTTVNIRYKKRHS